MQPTESNREVWDRIGAAGDRWFVAATSEEVARARAGDWNIKITPIKNVPRSWLMPVQNRQVLLLAGGGGQQAPILAAAGAEVTVVDNSRMQLERDRFIADRDGLTIKTIEADIRDLNSIADHSFDLVINPTSVCYCPEVKPVWQEAYRVLRPGGKLIAGMINPVNYLFDAILRDRDQLSVRHSVRSGEPYRDSDLPELDKERLLGPERPLEFGHSLGDLIGGQIESGFQMTGFFTDRWGGHDRLSDFIDVFVGTCASKPS